LDHAEKIFELIKAAGIRVHLDDTENHNPGWKYNYWE
jgi:prolyl-tRNA synthetase